VAAQDLWAEQTVPRQTLPGERLPDIPMNSGGGCDTNEGERAVAPSPGEGWENNLSPLEKEQSHNGGSAGTKNGEETAWLCCDDLSEEAENWGATADETQVRKVKNTRLACCNIDLVPSGPLVTKQPNVCELRIFLQGEALA